MRSISFGLLSTFVMLGACSGDGMSAASSDDGTASSQTREARLEANAPDPAGCDAGPELDRPRPVSKLIILHTNDLHSYLMGHAPEAEYTPATTGDDQTIGGIARIAGRIAAARKSAGRTPVLLLDSGDFMMGTPFELLGTTAAAELSLMNAIGYDATTFGNHEFDYGPGALALILSAAQSHGVTLPIVASNIHFDDSSPADDALASFETSGFIRRKLVKKLSNGLKVGIFGLLGKNAASVAPLARPVTFDDIAATARSSVADLRDHDKVDLVVALSHSGIDETGAGEDADLARAVPGIDVIISGHTHSVLPAPATVGSTLIVQTGAYGEHLGKLTLQIKKYGATTKIEPLDYELAPVDDSVAGSAAVQSAVDAYIGAIDAALQPAGLAYKQVVAKTTTDVQRTGLEENPMGDLVTDAYRFVTASVQPTQPPLLAIEANGDLRADILKGKTGVVWFADLFRVQPLGIGPDAKPGTPLVTFYVNGPSLKSGLEASAAAQDLLGSDDFFLQLSGASVEMDGTAAPLNRVKRVTIANTDVDLADASKCYKIATNLAVASLLGLIEQASGGALSVQPLEQDCATPVADLTTTIVDSDPATDGVQELKEWQALLAFVRGLPDLDGDGIPDVPPIYGASQGRITITK